MISNPDHRDMCSSDIREHRRTERRMPSWPPVLFPVMQARDLTSEERGVLDLLLTRRFQGRDALAAQAKTVQTTGLSCSCGCPSFALSPDRTLPSAEVAERMPTDAHGTDPDGNPVGVLLFVDDGYLSEVEVYSVDGSGFAGLPDAGALKLSQWSKAKNTGMRHLLNP